MQTLLNKKMEKIREWIFSKRPHIEGFDDDYNIIASKVLDSLHFMEFIYLIEELSETEIDVSNLEFIDFSTINRIKEKFFNHFALADQQN